MKKVQHVLSMTSLLVLVWGWSSLAEADCGGNSSCGMSHEKVQQTAATQTAPVQYTCPMHPEVVSDRPGECPKCGMNLEKVATKPDHETGSIEAMSAQCQQLAVEFAGLKAHFDKMMKLSDVDDLGPEMTKHGEMLTQFEKHFQMHLDMCRQMLNSENATKPGSTGTSTHKH